MEPQREPPATAEERRRSIDNVLLLFLETNLLPPMPSLPQEHRSSSSSSRNRSATPHAAFAENLLQQVNGLLSWPTKEECIARYLAIMKERRPMRSGGPSPPVARPARFGLKPPVHPMEPRRLTAASKSRSGRQSATRPESVEPSVSLDDALPRTRSLTGLGPTVQPRIQQDTSVKSSAAPTSNPHVARPTVPEAPDGKVPIASSLVDWTRQPAAARLGFSARHVVKEYATRAKEMSRRAEGDGRSVLIVVSDNSHAGSVPVRECFRLPVNLFREKMPFFADWDLGQSRPPGAGDDLPSTRSSTALIQPPAVAGKAVADEEPQHISVICNIELFTWLLQYVHAGRESLKDGTILDKPQLDLDNVTAVLRSSLHLKMAELVDECISFIQQHLNEVVATGPQKGTFDHKITTKLCRRLSLHDAHALKDPDDHLSSMLFKCYTRLLFEQPSLFHTTVGSSDTLFKCKHCRRVMTAKMEQHLSCLTSRIQIGRDGGIVYRHERCDEWTPSNYLHLLLSRSVQWKQIFWRLWGHLHLFRCGQCTMIFTAAECRVQCLRRATRDVLSTAGAEKQPSGDQAPSYDYVLDCLDRPQGLSHGNHVPKYCKHISSGSKPVARSCHPLHGSASKVELRSQSLSRMSAPPSASLATTQPLASQSVTNTSRPRPETSQARKDCSQREKNFNEVMLLVEQLKQLISPSANMPKWMVDRPSATWYRDCLSYNPDAADNPTKTHAKTKRKSRPKSVKTLSTLKQQPAAAASEKARAKTQEPAPAPSLPPFSQPGWMKMSGLGKEDGDMEAEGEDYYDSSSSDEPVEAQADVGEDKPKPLKPHILAKRRRRNVKRLPGYLWMEELTLQQNLDSLRENDQFRTKRLNAQQADSTTGPGEKQQSRPVRDASGIYGRLSHQFQALQRQKYLQHQAQQQQQADGARRRKAR
eukprot:scpid40691/ scgid10954/ Uncharacterized protein KIAA1841 homolog